MKTKKKWYKNIGLYFDRSFSKGVFKQLLWLVGIMLMVYAVLIILSYSRLFYEKGAEGSLGRWYDVLFVLVDPGSGNPSMRSHFIIICAVLGLIIFSGMLISVISNLLERRVDSFLKGETDYKVSDHVIILGFNSSVPSLLNVIYEKYGDVFVILMSECDSEEIRDRIQAHTKSEMVKGLIIMNGIRTADDDLVRLRLSCHPREIYVIGEEGEPAHDTVSLECVKKLSQMLPPGEVECHVQIDSYTMYSVLQSVDFGDTELDNGETIKAHLNFQPFNFNEIWSQKVLATLPKKAVIEGEVSYQYLPLDGEGIGRDSRRHVHLILLGMNDMSTSLAVNAAHILHFPNFKDGDFSTCSHITFIDPSADRQGLAFRNKYRHLFSLARWRAVDAEKAFDPSSDWVDPLGSDDSKYRHLGKSNFMDIQWEFIKGDVYDDAIQDYLVVCSQNESELTTIAICYEDSEHNASVCMALPESISNNANTILVRQKESAVTIELIRKIPPEYRRIRAFGMMDECYGENLTSDKFGKLVNACYCDLDIDAAMTPDGRPVQKLINEKWDDCSITEKWSSNYSANMLFTKLRSLGFADEEQITEQGIDDVIHDEMAQDDIQRTEHNRWNTEKLLLGFAPLTKEEQEVFLPLKDEKKALRSLKEQWKDKEKKHLDICSNEVLKAVDRWVVRFDTQVNSKLWTLYQMTKE